MDRLARRIAEGEPVVNLASYAQKIARLVLLESNARSRREAAVSQFSGADIITSHPSARPKRDRDFDPFDVHLTWNELPLKLRRLFEFLLDRRMQDGLLPR